MRVKRASFTLFKCLFYKGLAKNLWNLPFEILYRDVL